jgi:hypothetical protein
VRNISGLFQTNLTPCELPFAAVAAELRIAAMIANPNC